MMFIRLEDLHKVIKMGFESILMLKIDFGSHPMVKEMLIGSIKSNLSWFFFDRLYQGL